jgi:hypothetical protein
MKSTHSSFFFVVFFCISCTNNPKKITEPQHQGHEKRDTSNYPGKYLGMSELHKYPSNTDVVKPRAKPGKPFDTLHYNRIVAYDFEGSEEPYPGVLDKNGNFVPVILAQKLLSQAQADFIISHLANPKTYGGATAACFRPHLGIVFYEGARAVFVVNVCLDCNFLISTSDIPAMSQGQMNAGAKGEYTVPAIGFSETGKSGIRNFCTELGFHYGRGI